MAGKKRSRSGHIKPTDAPQQSPTDTPVTEPTPPCAQPQSASSKTTGLHSTSQANKTSSGASLPIHEAPDTSNPPQQAPSKPKPRTRKHEQRQKLPKLPPNASISKRPLLHPSLPTPFASSSSPKTLYITSNTPFIPALKRIRKLLAEISRREKQSLAATSRQRRPLEASGRLKNGDVERAIADGVAGQEGKEGEKVFLKATGRAIPRALELGVQFQGEGEGCVVRVEMGSVKAVDDVEVSGDGVVEGDVPETRIRSVSSVTVSIGMK